MRRAVMMVLSVVLGACSVRLVTGATVVGLDEPIGVRDPECAVDEVLSEFVDHAEDVVGEATAEAAVAAYRRENPGRVRGLTLDEARSTESQRVFVDDRGRARLVVDVRQVVDRSWVIAGTTSCLEG
jgi:hypothetical protein